MNIPWRKVISHPALQLVIAAGLLFGRTAAMYQPDIFVDDAFISFRYASNFASGQGLVFNPGERVEGYTNFLWTLTLAACRMVGFDIPGSALILAGISALGILLVLYVLGCNLFESKPAASWLVVLPLLLFAGFPSQARHILSGMETLFFGFWLILGVHLFLFSQRPALAGLALALCAMTRPEGNLYFVILLGASLLFRGDRNFSGIKNVKGLVEFAAGFGLVYGMYFLWRYEYYGFLLPNTFYAKAAGFSWERAERGLDVLLQVISEWRVAPLLILALFSLPWWRKDKRWVLLGTMIFATFIYFIYVGGDFIVWFGPRFLMPILPLVLALSAAGLSWIFATRFLSERISLVGQLLVILAILVYGWLSWPGPAYALDFFSAQMRSWRELGEWISVHTPPQAVIATDAAGLIPYYAERHTIDMFGLTDLHIAHLETPGFGSGVVAHEKYDPRYILERQPDCIVSTWLDDQGNAVSAGLDSVREEFEANYQLMAVAKVRFGPPADGGWVITLQEYSSELFTKGYQTGLFCRQPLEVTTAGSG